MDPASPPAEIVVVAARDLAPGRIVAEADLYAVRAPPEMLGLWPSAVYDDPADVIGRVAWEPILADEPIVRARIGDPTPRFAPADGHLGWMVASDAPGDRVDLVRPGDGGCAAVRDAPVLRRGPGTLLVEVAPEDLPALTATDVAALPAPSRARRCRGVPAPASVTEPARRPPLTAPIAVPVAVRDLPAGQIVSVADVAIAVLPADFVSGKVLLDKQEIVGRRVTAEIYRGEPLRTERLGPESPSSARTPIPSVVAVPTVAGGPWWPTDRVAVLDAQRCLGPEGTIAGAWSVRAATALVDAADPDGFVAARIGQAVGVDIVLVHPDEVAWSGPPPGPGTLVALPDSGLAGLLHGKAAAICRTGPLLPSKPQPVPTLPSWVAAGVVGRLVDEQEVPVADARVQYGDRNGAWSGEVRPDADGRFAIPRHEAPQTWLRVESPGRDPAVVGVRTPTGWIDLGILLYAAGRCTPTPGETPWSAVTDPSLWRRDWRLPDVPGMRWVRLAVDGPLVEEKLLVSLVETPDGGADAEVRGRGFGGGAATAHLGPDAWAGILDTARRAVDAVPATIAHPDPTAIHCATDPTRFRLEVGTDGVPDGFLRDELAPGSTEESVVSAVLAAVGLDLAR